MHAHLAHLSAARHVLSPVSERIPTHLDAFITQLSRPVVFCVALHMCVLYSRSRRGRNQPCTSGMPPLTAHKYGVWHPAMNWAVTSIRPECWSPARDPVTWTIHQTIEQCEVSSHCIHRSWVPFHCSNTAFKVHSRWQCDYLHTGAVHNSGFESDFDVIPFRLKLPKTSRTSRENAAVWKHFVTAWTWCAHI